MSLNLTNNFFRLLLYFRNQNLVSFTSVNFFEEHKRLYDEAKQTNDYVPCTVHYYSLMSTVIQEYFSGNFHFVAPLFVENLKKNNSCKVDNKKNNLISANKKLIRIDKLEDALIQLHNRIGNILELCEGKSCVDIGCGTGGVILHLASTGANLTGLTVTPNDVKCGTIKFKKEGIDNTCQIIEARCERYMPLKNESQDAAYAIYALKYFSKLHPVLAETSRILKPGGLFAVYDLMKSDKFDNKNPEHNKILEHLQFACGMPSLYSRTDLIKCASEVGLELVKTINLDLEAGLPFYYCFTSSSIFMWLIRSTLIDYLIKMKEWMGLLPKGFYTFNKVFLSGTVDSIVSGGEAGILNGGEIILFRKIQNSS